MIPLKSTPDDILGRFREVISDPLNLLIHRIPLAGLVEKNEVYLHGPLFDVDKEIASKVDNNLGRT